MEGRPREVWCCVGWKKGSEGCLKGEVMEEWVVVDGGLGAEPALVAESGVRLELVDGLALVAESELPPRTPGPWAARTPEAVLRVAGVLPSEARPKAASSVAAAVPVVVTDPSAVSGAAAVPAASNSDVAAERALAALGWEGGLEVARSFTQRLLGFTVRRESDGSVLAFPRCSSVHTCFMRFPLDIAFVDAAGKVLLLAREVAPWRVVSYPGASMVLERAARPW